MSLRSVITVIPAPVSINLRVSGSLPALSQGQDHLQDDIIVPGLMEPAVSFIWIHMFPIPRLTTEGTLPRWLFQH
jgi:hypothetical protein